MPYGTDLQLGKALDAPADAAPPSSPVANMADEMKTKSVEEFGSMNADTAPANRFSLALPFERDAWLGSPVTAESIEQCTVQLDQARFLLVKVSAPENVREKVAAFAATDFRGVESAREELFGSLRSEVQPSPQLGQVFRSLSKPVVSPRARFSCRSRF